VDDEDYIGAVGRGTTSMSLQKILKISGKIYEK